MPGGAREPGPDGGLGIDRRRRPGARVAAAPARPHCGSAGARARDVAPLSQGGRAGSEPPAAGTAPAAEAAALCGAIPGVAVYRRGPAVTGTAGSRDPLIALDLGAMHDASRFGIERIAAMQDGKIVPHQQVTDL